MDSSEDPRADLPMSPGYLLPSRVSKQGEHRECFVRQQADLGLSDPRSCIVSRPCQTPVQTYTGSEPHPDFVTPEKLAKCGFEIYDYVRGYSDPDKYDVQYLKKKVESQLPSKFRAGLSQQELDELEGAKGKSKPTHVEMSTTTLEALQSSRPPFIPKKFDANQPSTIRLYPLENYTFGTKENQPEEDPSVLARLKRLEEHYEQHGMRRTCEGVLVCHEHNHPHILMLQIANAFFKLPGDYLHPDEDEIPGFKARLNERLAPVGSQFTGEAVNNEWIVGDTLAQWWRPNFETFMYPFLPAHVTRPKECKKLFLIQLPSEKVLSVPKNMKLLAVPLFELYDNTARYGPQLAAIPHLLARYNFEFVDKAGNVTAVTPGSQDPSPAISSKTVNLEEAEVNGHDSEMKGGDDEGNANGSKEQIV